MAGFVNKNRTLVIVLVIVAIAAIVLGWFDVTAYWSIAKSMKSITENHKEIMRINQTGQDAPEDFEYNENWTPADEAQFVKWEKQRRDTHYVAENRFRINQDAEALDQKTHEIQRVFGHIYDKALNAFLDDLRTPATIVKTVPAAPAAQDAKAEVKDVKAVAKDAKSEAKDAKSVAKDAKPEAKDAKAVAKDAKAEVKDAKIVAKDAKSEAKDAKTIAKDVKEVKPAVKEEKKIEAVAEMVPVQTEENVELPESVKIALVERFGTTEIVKPQTDEEDQPVVKTRMTFEELADYFNKVLPKNKREMDDLMNPSEAQQMTLFANFRKAVCAAPSELKNEEKELFEKQAEARFDRAFGVFKQEAQKSTVEVITGKNERPAIAMLMQALGLPRSMTGTDFMTYIEEIQKQMLAQDIVPLISKDKKADILSIMMNLDKNSTLQRPPKGNIPHIICRFQIYEDLFFRMKKCGIVSLEKLDALDLFGKQQGDYRTYSFEISVRGSMNQIRSFMNSIHNAYVDNRVYRMGAFSAKQMQTSMKSVSKDTAQNNEVARAQGYMAHLKHAVANHKSDPKTSKLPYDETAEMYYGAAQVGLNDQVLADFSIEYILYVGDQVTKSKGGRQ